MDAPTTRAKRRLPPEGDPGRYAFFTVLQCPVCRQWADGFKFDHKCLRDDGMDKHATCNQCGWRFIAVGNLSEE
jgi:hypothetical protein